jgi:cytochrome oxidase Cu insertion factor (SCO1/SenC/PrrC family)
VRTPTKTRRGNEAARRAATRRRLWIAFGAGAAVLAGVIALIAVAATGRNTSAPTPAVGVGAKAPNGSFTTSSGTDATIASLRGHPTLVWFVATWCSSCQAGTQALSGQIGNFAARGVRVVELELADDLGQPGPGIASFGQQYAGAAYTNPDWTWGVASAGLTTAYDSAGYLDIYYLLDSSGHIVYVNSAPGSTMGPLLVEVSRVGTRG